MKLPGGTTTVVPSSPPGEQRIGQVSADGSTLELDGHLYTWTGLAYARRRWLPYGPWDTYYFKSDETYDKYEQDSATGNHIWTETGHYYPNG